MSLKHKLRRLLLCVVLEGAALLGAPVLPRDIDHLMRLMHRTVVEVTTSDGSDDPIPPLR